MRNFRKIGTALVLAGFVATGMIASSAELQAAGGGNSKTAICRNLDRAIAAAIALGPDAAELVAYLEAQKAAIGCE